MANITVTPGLTDWSSLGIASGDTIYVHQGVQVVSAGTDLSTKDRMVNIYFGPDSALTFSSVLKTGTSGTLQSQMRGGKLILQAACTGTGSNTFAKVLWQGPAALVDNGGGTWTAFEQTTGDADVAEGTIITTMRKYGGTADVGYNSTAITTFDHTGGSAAIRRSVTTGNISNGSIVTFAREVITGTSSIAATTLNVYAGKVNWYGGAITTLNLNSPDSRFFWQDMRESVTIGTTNGNAKALAKSGITAASGGTLTSAFGATVTLTTVNVLAGRVSDYLTDPPP
jgi:hypothetical protein